MENSLLPLLGLLFIALKLCHVIAWSWLWVLAPFWLGFVIAIAVLFVVLLCQTTRSPRYGRRTAYYSRGRL